MILTRMTLLKMMSIDAMTTLRVEALPDAFRAATRRESQIAAHDRDQKSEHDGLQGRRNQI